MAGDISNRCDWGFKHIIQNDQTITVLIETFIPGVF